MMQFDRILLRSLTVVLPVLLLPSTSHAINIATESDCRVLHPVENLDEREPLEFADALLWKISRDNHQSSYILGTIHVADRKITRLPGVVEESLLDSELFVMEALPDPEELLLFSQMMLFPEGQQLQDYLDPSLFEKTSAILARYKIPAVMANQMQPWAAFLMMNYPAESGLPLDLHLLQLASKNGAELLGLETVSEQANVFISMSTERQLQLLLDSVCNYHLIEDDFEEMKSLYLRRDLAGLYYYSNRYGLDNDPAYMELLEKLLFERNTRMTERLQPILIRGNAFIAVGAMHLPGQRGILSQLNELGFSITPVY